MLYLLSLYGLVAFFSLVCFVCLLCLICLALLALLVFASLTCTAWLSYAVVDFLSMRFLEKNSDSPLLVSLLPLLGFPDLRDLLG